MIRSFKHFYVLLLCVVGASILLTSCGHKKIIANKYDPWILESTDIDDEYGTYLANGFISTRIMGEGIGSKNGSPLPCYMAGLYQNEKITPLPTWSDIRIFDGSSPFVIDGKAHYKQTLNMKEGILTTEGEWKAGKKSLKGKVTVFVSRDWSNLGFVIFDMQPNFSGSISVRQILGKPQGLKHLSTSIKNNDSSSLWQLNGTTGPQFLSSNTRFISSDRAPLVVSPESEEELTTTVDKDVEKGKFFRSGVAVSWSRGNSAQEAEADSYTKLKDAFDANGLDESEFILSHAETWSKLWSRDIIIEGDLKAQQELHSCMFYLLQSVREDSPWSIAPMGLSNSSFNGHIFWDADIWMFPALILQHPELARSIVEYRYRTLEGARQNAAKFGMKGAQFAWESGETGVEDVPPEISYVHERHINNDVSLAQWQYYLATLDKEWLRTRGYPVISASADYWVSRVKYINDRYEILQVVPPDENAGLVDNNAYTNAGAKLNLEIATLAAKAIGAVPNPNWKKVADAMYIPFDTANNRYLARDEYKDEVLKQADPELIIYPLQIFPKGTNENAVAQSTYDYYVPKINPNGPAMSASVHSLIAGRLGNKEECLKHYELSYQPFLRGSFNYFNEKRSITYHNDCFLTGAAGPIQALIFGMVGARIDYFDIKPLEYKACLPEKWKSITLKGVQWQGEVFDVTIDASGVRVKPMPGS